MSITNFAQSIVCEALWKPQRPEPTFLQFHCEPIQNTKISCTSMQYNILADPSAQTTTYPTIFISHRAVIQNIPD